MIFMLLYYRISLLLGKDTPFFAKEEHIAEIKNVK